MPKPVIKGHRVGCLRKGPTNRFGHKVRSIDGTVTIYGIHMCLDCKQSIGLLETIVYPPKEEMK
jgi:hypothetical protein